MYVCMYFVLIVIQCCHWVSILYMHFHGARFLIHYLTKCGLFSFVTMKVQMHYLCSTPPIYKNIGGFKVIQ